MILGFTGSSTIVTAAQADALEAWLLAQLPEELLHGDCVVADAMAHSKFRRLFPDRHITIYPPDNPRLRAFCDGPPEFVTIVDPAPYLVRDRDIAQECDELLALSDSWQEKLRSGTFATARYALGYGKKVTVIWPDGRVEPDWARTL